MLLVEYGRVALDIDRQTGSVLASNLQCLDDTRARPTSIAPRPTSIIVRRKHFHVPAEDRGSPASTAALGPNNPPLPQARGCTPAAPPDVNAYPGGSLDRDVAEPARVDGGDVGTRGAAKSKRTAAATVSPSVDSIYPDGSYAVVIGINDYASAGVDPEDGGMHDLRSARQDAERVRDTLVERGFIVLGELYDSEATPRAMRCLLSSVKQTMKGKRSARLCFYLAAHGVREDEGSGWICCHGADKFNLEATCIEMQELKRFSRRVDCCHQLYVLDVCHAGMLLTAARNGNAAIDKTVRSRAFERAMLGSPSIMAMCGTASGQDAMESDAGGIFSTAFVDALRHVGAGNDHDFVVATELYSYILRAVLEEAAQRGCTQTPKFEPLWQFHKKTLCDGQMLFAKKT